MPGKTWILVADASRARLFESNKKAGPWQLIEEFEHPASAAKGHDIVADRFGRVQQSVANGTRSAMEPSTDPKEVEALRFAQKLVAVLEHGHGRNAYARLVLVAPPEFLGMLRKAIPPGVAHRVVASVNKDLTQVPDRLLPERLANEL